MDDTKKMLKMIITGQSVMKSDLITEIRKVDKKVEELREETRKGFKKVDERIDKLGFQIANLEDDAPTVEEFDDSIQECVNFIHA